MLEVTLLSSFSTVGVCCCVFTVLQAFPYMNPNQQKFCEICYLSVVLMSLNRIITISEKLPVVLLKIACIGFSMVTLKVFQWLPVDFYWLPEGFSVVTFRFFNGFLKVF